jgi:hypothetical protein
MTTVLTMIRQGTKGRELTLAVVLTVNRRDSCDGVSRQDIGTSVNRKGLAKEVAFWHDETWLCRTSSRMSKTPY